MEANGPEPNIYTYNTVTRAFAEAGRLEVRTFYVSCTVLYTLAGRFIGYRSTLRFIEIGRRCSQIQAGRQTDRHTHTLAER